MATEESTVRGFQAADLTEVLVRLGIVAALVFMSIRVFSPFANLMIWGLILAIALYPVHSHLAARLGNRQGLAATLFVLAVLLLIGVPTVLLGASFASHLSDAYHAFQNQSLTLSAPDPAVAQWPVIGERLYAAWSAAAANLPSFLEANKETLTSVSRQVLAAAAHTTGDVLLFLAAVVVAGIMMAYARPASKAMAGIFARVSGPGRGPGLQRLVIQTVRSVAAGVVGVAFIQALLLGMGFIIGDIPAAGVLALIVLLLGIVQVPALLVSLPAVGYLWWAGDGSTIGNVVLSVYLIVAGMADNVLKPLLLGRGVDAPMVVILIGAIGGMVTGGIVGLFVGAVVLAVTYQIFMEWVAAPPASEPVPTAATPPP